jgi:hypothetical protein
MINRLNFYKSIRADFGKLSTKQVEGFESILNEWDKSKYSDIRWLAYMLATVWHETAKTVQPIEEYGKGKSYKYGKKVKHSGVDYTTPDKLFYGRGFVQLTWYENYQLLGRLLNINLLNQPELALQLDVATKILFEGMTKGSSSIGDFTGKCLEQYFNDKVEDPLGARKIINGSDKAELITIYYMIFKKALL